MPYSKLPDTPWHIGYIRRDEMDERRHKSRCVYNDGKLCNNAYMTYCYGSSHCKYYAEDWDTAKKFEESMKIKYTSGVIISNCKNSMQILSSSKKIFHCYMKNL